MRLPLPDSQSTKIIKNKSLLHKLGHPVVLLPLIPFFILVSLELFYTGNIRGVAAWIINYSKEFILSYIMMFAISNIFYIFPRRIYLTISSIMFSLFSILGFVSRQKLINKGSPLVPSDLLLAKEALEISSAFKGVAAAVALIIFSSILIIFLIIKFVPAAKYRCSRKIAVFSLSALLLFFLYTYFGQIQRVFALELINYSQAMNYDQNGMILGFILESKNQKINSPSDYQQDTINSIVQNNKASYPVNPDFKPNIIFVMSEAFWDPTLMKNITFNQDPIPFFHSLQKSQTSGTMLSAVYGGGTANTEFEALTGFSSQFLPAGTIAYSQYINRPIEALPTILKSQGYSATAIHTYDNWFYGRNNVYKSFGFDKFISKEFLNSPQYQGNYISDSELTNQILKEVNDTNKPDFIYAVSMENHGPYGTSENPGNAIKAEASNLTPESQAILNNYANTISDVDKSLQQLIEGLEKSNQPTLVIFYGDHLPLLGDNYSVYKDAGFFTDGNSYEDYLSLHSVPFVTWNNFGLEANNNLRLSANYMGTLALEMAQKSGSPMTDFLSTLMKDDSDTIIDPVYQSQEKINLDQISKYKDLQYDLLFGNKFTYELMPSHTPKANDDYIHGNALPSITDVTISGDELTVHGENFVENDRIYINDKEIKTIYNGTTSLTAVVPKNTENKKISIQLKLKDSMNKVISQSNIYSID